jgi:hypothetical protein
VDAAGFEGGADDEGVAGGGEGPGEEALGLAGGDAEEVLERGAAGDGEGGELVLGEQFAGAFDAVLALGGGDGDGFVGAVFQGGDRRAGSARSGGVWASEAGELVEGEGGRSGGGGGKESSAGEHEEIVGW